MAKKRLFTKKELDEFSKDFMGLTVEALEKGDIEKAKYWVRRQDATKDFIHDLFLHWIAGLLSHIYDNWGEDAAARAVRETAGHGQSGFSIPSALNKQKVIKEGGLKAYIQLLIDVWRQHSMYPGTTVEEDDEKIILKMKQCGSGGRLINMGAYEGPFGYRKLKNPGPHTWGEKDLPIYCAHCPIVHEIVPLQYFGEGAQLHVHASPFPKKPGDPCIYHIYKDPKNIPDKYYERIGMTREGRTLPPTYGVDPEKDAASTT
jgi:hypothetical protein